MTRPLEEPAKVSWCETAGCPERYVMVPVKYGTTMTCAACGKTWPIVTLRFAR